MAENSTEFQLTPERIIHRLEWQVIRKLDGLLQGDYRTLFYGAGTDFADLREYQAMDDIRHIDWNVTARMNQPYVRQYVEEREITAWFLLDLSPSMTFGPASRPKESVLIDFVSVLARLLVRNGNRIGAILYDNQTVKTIPPKTGRTQLLRLTRELLRGADSDGKDETDLKRLLKAGMNTFVKRSQVFVVSDFISKPGWEKPLSQLNHRHDMVAVRMWDPAEYELPDAGLMVIEDTETGEQLHVDTSDPVFRRRFAQVAEKRESDLEAAMKKAGVDLFAVSTNEDLVRVIMRMAHLRKYRRK